MKFEIPWGGDIYDCEWIAETDFEKLTSVSGVSGFVFDDEGKLCVVAFKDKKDWTLPGGHLEKDDKTFEDCFIRETFEEADLELKDIKRVGYIGSIKRGDSEGTRDHHLRFVARVLKMNEQTIDPAEGYIPQRKFIHPEEFVEYTKWNDNGEIQLKKALEVLERSEN